MGKPVCSRIGQIYYFHIGHNVPCKHPPPPPKKKKKIAESVSSISLGTTVILKRNWQHRYAKFIYLLIIIVIITIIIFLFWGGGGAAG